MTSRPEPHPVDGRRIWILNHYAETPGHPGGTRHYSLARAAVELGADVTIFAAGTPHVSDREDRVGSRRLARSRLVDGVRFIWVRTTPYQGNTWRRMLNMISYAALVLPVQARRPRPDVVVGSTVHPFAALAGLIIAKARGVAFVYEIRDLWPQTLVDLGAMRATSPLARMLYRLEALLVRQADIVLSLLPGIGEYLRERGLPDGHVRYLPNGALQPGPADPPVPATATARLLERLAEQRQQGEVVFAYVGAHGRVNRLDVVLEAFRLAQERGAPPMALALVGDGPEKPRLMELAERDGHRSVLFADPVPKLDVPALLANADVGVVHTTSTPVYRFGISFNKLFDYMAASLPVAFATSTAYDPVAASACGMSVEPDDPAALADVFIAMAEAGPDERSEMGRAGRTYLAEHHDMARLGRRFADIVGDLAGQQA